MGRTIIVPTVQLEIPYLNDWFTLINVSAEITAEELEQMCVNGTTLTIEFDGKTYVCAPKYLEGMMDNVWGYGNTKLLNYQSEGEDFEDTGEPFAFTPLYGEIKLVCFPETTSCTFGVYIGETSSSDEYVIMPKADYQAICNAVRNKTDKAELIKSGDMANEIGGIDTIPKTTAIDYSDFDNGTFKETLDNGTELTYTVEFGEDGKAVNVITPNGRVIPINYGYLFPAIQVNGFSEIDTVYQADIAEDDVKAIIATISNVLPLGTAVEVIAVVDGVRHKARLTYTDDMAEDEVHITSLTETYFWLHFYREGDYYGGNFDTSISGTSHTIALIMEG